MNHNDKSESEKNDRRISRLLRLRSRAITSSQYIQDISIIKNFKRAAFQFVHDIEKNEMNFIATPVEREQGVQFLRENNIDLRNVSNLFPSKIKKVVTRKKYDVETEKFNHIDETFKDTERKCEEAEEMWQEYLYKLGV